MERFKSFFENVEYWMLERDLHIYAAILSVIAISILGWMLYTEADKNHSLRNHNIELTSQLLDKERRLLLLQSEMDMTKVSVINTDPKPVQETVEKVSNKLNAKIEKVQNTLINSKLDTKVITKTETQTIEKPVPVDSELKNMMRQSFCNSNPQDKSCAKVIKK